MKFLKGIAVSASTLTEITQEIADRIIALSESYVANDLRLGLVESDKPRRGDIVYVRTKDSFGVVESFSVKETSIRYVDNSTDTLLNVDIIRDEEELSFKNRLIASAVSEAAIPVRFFAFHKKPETKPSSVEIDNDPYGTFICAAKLKKIGSKKKK